MAKKWSRDHDDDITINESEIAEMDYETETAFIDQAAMQIAAGIISEGKSDIGTVARKAYFAAADLWVFKTEEKCQKELFDYIAGCRKRLTPQKEN